MSRFDVRSSGVLILRLWLIATALFLPAYSSKPSQARAATMAASDPIPVLAYYYIWFDVKSWDRAKTDYPLLGRYSSSDIEVMRQHVKWAKAAGIKGFIVSWKSTERLNQRLEQLIQVANEEDFKLAIIYQGLDFDRNPLPSKQVDADLSYFIDHYADNQAFSIFEKPLVIWSGTWEFSREEVDSVVLGKRDHLLILASERNLKGYSRLADLVDGNAYYWSSVNPDTFPGYPEKLQSMSKAVHANGGLWIAPAAPGFDARLIGGTTVVDRKDGTMLQIQYNVAMQSSPDAIGLISWNEFSENSHIEPSENYGDRYLKVLADIRHVPAPVIPDFDSSEPGDTVNDVGTSRIIALGSIGLLTIICLVILVRRIIR
ncbi:MAG TPA: endo-1,3-alpha-glucanase family glycosylhydrolase [Anaerolineales bacterium]|nr:endo-1,3-alpha-glucanase family glycosylhydrolase [Anaerolineales bacterium]